jgi:hypothetical protein
MSTQELTREMSECISAVRDMMARTDIELARLQRSIEKTGAVNMMLKDTLDTLELDPRRCRGSGYLMRRTEFVLQTYLCQGALPCLD